MTHTADSAAAVIVGDVANVQGPNGRGLPSDLPDTADAKPAR